jgi:hypothetical protein
LQGRGEVAVTAFILAVAGSALTGFHRVYWFLTATTMLVLGASILLPGRPARTEAS